MLNVKLYKTIKHSEPPSDVRVQADKIIINEKEIIMLYHVKLTHKFTRGPPVKNFHLRYLFPIKMKIFFKSLQYTCFINKPHVYNSQIKL